MLALELVLLDAFHAYQLLLWRYARDWLLLFDALALDLLIRVGLLLWEALSAIGVRTRRDGCVEGVLLVDIVILTCLSE